MEYTGTLLHKHCKLNRVILSAHDASLVVRAFFQCTEEQTVYTKGHVDSEHLHFIHQDADPGTRQGPAPSQRGCEFLGLYWYELEPSGRQNSLLPIFIRNNQINGSILS
jgi:hypothetical protein